MCVYWSLFVCTYVYVCTPSTSCVGPCSSVHVLSKFDKHMCTCTCVLVSLCVFGWIHACVCVYAVHVCMHCNMQDQCMYVCTIVLYVLWIHVCVYVCTSVCVCMFAHTPFTSCGCTCVSPTPAHAECHIVYWPLHPLGLHGGSEALRKGAFSLEGTSPTRCMRCSHAHSTTL